MAKPFPLTFVLVGVVLHSLAAQEVQQIPEGDIRTLMDRVIDSATVPAAAFVESAAPANVLWTMQAADNSACVRGAGDLDGDGVADAISGNDINGTADNLFAISGASSGAATVVWAIETQGGASGGSFWGDESVSIGSDFTGDGIGEILGGTAWGGRSGICFDGADGSPVWQLDTYSEFASGWVYSIIEIPDVTGDGVPEVVFGCGSDNDSVYCIDGTSSGTAPTVLWSYQTLDAVFDVTWIPDVSGDGRPDIIAGTGDNDDRIYCLASDTGALLWVHSPGGSVYCLETIQDVDSDGVRDIVAAVWNSSKTATCISGATGHVIWGQGGVGTFGMKVAALRDVTGDGIDEVLLGSWDNSIICLDGSDGTFHWRTPTGTMHGGDVWTISAIPDINGDGFDDCIAGSFDTSIYACDGRDGAILWMQGTGNRLYSVSWVGDQNGDGKPEAIAGTQDTISTTVVYGIEGDSGLIPPFVVLTGTAQIGTAVTAHTTGIPGEGFFLLLSLGTASLPVSAFGNLLLDPATLFVLAGGGIPADGTDDTLLPLANSAALIGTEVHFQSLVGADLFGGVGAFTNRSSVTIN